MSRDILLLVEHRDGTPEPITYQLVAQARALADAGGGRCCALLLCGDGATVVDRLNGAGLDALYVVEDPALNGYNPEAFGRAAAAAVSALQPGLFLCGHSYQGTEVAPWVAATLSAPLLPNCVEIAVDGEELVAERLLYGQAWQARYTLPWRGTVVASLARRGGTPDAAEAPPPPAERVDVDLASEPVRTVVTSVIAPVAGDVDLAHAEVVIGVGRGVRDPANLPLLEELAEVLGGVVACSRPLVDLDWMPYERQVGVSGQAIRPKVYIACGISGAAQHLAGITEAETIVAINQDARAPIFRVAHYGVVGDLLKIVPALVEEARRRR